MNLLLVSSIQVRGVKFQEVQDWFFMVTSANDKCVKYVTLVSFARDERSRRGHNLVVYGPLSKYINIFLIRLTSLHFYANAQQKFTMKFFNTEVLPIKNLGSAYAGTAPFLRRSLRLLLPRRVAR